jgi:hypothetical protein
MRKKAVIAWNTWNGSSMSFRNTVPSTRLHGVIIQKLTIWITEVESKFVSLVNLFKRYAMKTWGSGNTAQFFLTSALDGSGQLHALTALTPAKQPAVPLEYEVRWNLKPVWNLWRREKPRSCRESKPGPPAHCRSLYQLSYSGSILF